MPSSTSRITKRYIQHRNSIPYWNGVSRRKSKNAGINTASKGRRLVGLETIFNHPSWR